MLGPVLRLIVRVAVVEEAGITEHSLGGVPTTLTAMFQRLRYNRICGHKPILEPRRRELNRSEYSLILRLTTWTGSRVRAPKPQSVFTLQ